MNFMKKSMYIIMFTAFTPFAVSFAGAEEAAIERPQEQVFRAELKKELSTVYVPIEATAAELGKILNQMIGTDIYKGSTRYSGLTADITRNGVATITAADNYLYLTLPISLKLSYGMFQVPPLSLKLKFKMAARITPDWKLFAEIYYMGLSDLLAEDVRVGPIAIKPRSIVEGVTQPVQKLLSELLSRAVNARYPLKDQIAKVWLAAQKPVLLDKNYSAWLRINPQEVMLSPLFAQNNLVRLGLGIATYADLVVGPEPSPQAPTALPNLKSVNSIDRSFRVSVNSDLHFRDLLAIASPLLLDKEFDSDGKKITIKAVDVYGNGDKLVVKLDTIGSFEGTFYLTGKPQYNPQTNIFSMSDVDFDMKTKSFLMRSAAWLLHGFIRNIIQEKLVMDMTPQLEKAREMARKAISQVKLAEGIFLKGSVKTIKVNDLLVSKEKIAVQVYAEGDTAVVFQ